MSLPNAKRVSIDGAEAVMDWRADGQELAAWKNVTRDGRQFAVTLPVTPGR